MFRSIVVGTDGSDTAGKAVAEAIDLAKAGFEVQVIKDFTASVHPENDDATTFELNEAGARLQLAEVRHQVTQPERSVNVLRVERG